jgi:hypothetical protein
MSSASNAPVTPLWMAVSWRFGLAALLCLALGLGLGLL